MRSGLLRKVFSDVEDEIGSGAGYPTTWFHWVLPDVFSSVFEIWIALSSSFDPSLSRKNKTKLPLLDCRFYKRWQNRIKTYCSFTFKWLVFFWRSAQQKTTLFSKAVTAWELELVGVGFKAWHLKLHCYLDGLKIFGFAQKKWWLKNSTFGSTWLSIWSWSRIWRVMVRSQWNVGTGRSTTGHISSLGQKALGDGKRSEVIGLVI